MPGHSNRPDLNVHSILTSLCAFSCSPILFQNIHSQLYWMLPRRVFKKYWCSIQSPYLKLSCQNRPQSLVFCKSSIWDSFLHPALSTIAVKYHTNYTSPKPPGLSIYHPPKPQAILHYTSHSVINLQSLSLPSQDFQCALWNLCLYWLSFLYPLPLWFSILQPSLKQNKTKMLMGQVCSCSPVFQKSYCSFEFQVIRPHCLPLSLGTVIPYSLRFSVINHVLPFHLAPTTIVGGVGIYAGSL